MLNGREISTKRVFRFFIGADTGSMDIILYTGSFEEILQPI